MKLCVSIVESLKLHDLEIRFRNNIKIICKGPLWPKIVLAAGKS